MKGTRFIEQDKKAVVCHIEGQVCNDLLPGFQQWSNGDRHRIVTVINIHNPPPTPKEQREVSVFAEHGKQRINQGHVVQYAQTWEPWAVHAEVTPDGTVAYYGVVSQPF